MDPYDKSHASPAAGIHYRKTSSGNYECNKEICDYKIEVQTPVDRKNDQTARTAIRNHCEGCYPNLIAASNAARVKRNSTLKNHARRLLIANRSRVKRNFEIAQEEVKAKNEGVAKQFECALCHQTFATELAKNKCETRCRMDCKSRVSLFVKTCPQITGEELHDSQQTNSTEESDFPGLLMQVVEANHKRLFTSTRWALYFVVVVDESASTVGLSAYLRANATNPKCIIQYYVGKRTTHNVSHDILKDHWNRRSSSILKALEDGTKVAYEIHREHYNSLQDLETAEAFWILLGVCRERIQDGKSRPQWTALNKILPVSTTHVYLTMKEKHDACSLAKKHHEIMCVVPDCSKEHNVKKRHYFAMFHCPDAEIKLLSIEDFKNLEDDDFDLQD